MPSVRTGPISGRDALEGYGQRRRSGDHDRQASGRLSGQDLAAVVLGCSARNTSLTARRGPGRSRLPDRITYPHRSVACKRLSSATPTTRGHVRARSKRSCSRTVLQPHREQTESVLVQPTTSGTTTGIPASARLRRDARTAFRRQQPRRKKRSAAVFRAPDQRRPLPRLQHETRHLYGPQTPPSRQLRNRPPRARRDLRWHTIGGPAPTRYPRGRRHQSLPSHRAEHRNRPGPSAVAKHVGRCWSRKLAARSVTRPRRYSVATSAESESSFA